MLPLTFLLPLLLLLLPLVCVEGKRGRGPPGPEGATSRVFYRVFCRVRPLLPEREIQTNMIHLHFPSKDRKSLVLSKTEESRVTYKDITYKFHFDWVFPPSSSQAEVFEEISLLVQSALDGYRVCTFTYGQMGSGKTYTLEGPKEMEPQMASMIPQASEELGGGGGAGRHHTNLRARKIV
uniref:Kinesin motor domain-containing protein n=1 Tax=Anolis carolinensis TaxID=28377 RepID=A0A803SL88_ANOCA